MLGPGAPESATSATLLRFIRQGRSFSGHERHCCFLNTRGTPFADVSSVAALNFDDDGRAIGQVDWDHDGDLDFWIANRNGPQVRFLRNDLKTENHYLSLKLEGTACNRDAIGSRAEVVLRGETKRRLVRTLRAGDGYLSQSSKWMHFGLGANTSVDRVIVTWPSGESESFRGVKVDSRCVLIQGNKHAVALPSGQQSVALRRPADENLPANEFREPNALASGARPENAVIASLDASAFGSGRFSSSGRLSDIGTEAAADSQSIQLMSAARLVMPLMSYETSGGKRELVFRRDGSPVFVILWASWCAPCLGELTEFARGQDQIASLGIDVVALSLDGIDPSRPEYKDDAVNFLNSIQFPFSAGWANDRLIDKLQLVNNQMFDLHLPLPLPAGVLIDGTGRLAAIYKGKVSISGLVQDVRRLGLEGNDLRDASVPFSGRWAGELKSLSLLPILRELIGRGHLAAADDYVRRLGEAPKGALIPLIVQLGIELRKQGHLDRSTEHFRVAKQMDPTNMTLELQMGLTLERSGRVADAIELYERVLEQNEDSTRILNNLAWLLATTAVDKLRRPDRAVELASRSVELSTREKPTLLDTLAATYASNGQFTEAIAVAEEAISVARSQGRLNLVQRIEGRLERYRQRRPYRQPVTASTGK